LDVTVERDHVRLETSDGPRCAAFVIGADGANSLVRRRVSQAFRRDQLSIATGYFARGVTSDEIVLELLSDPPGYIWSFPRPDHLAIGVCGQADAGVTVGQSRH
jgi:flavin-dependent dehydrogenase